MCIDQSVHQRIIINRISFSITVHIIPLKLCIRISILSGITKSKVNQVVFHIHVFDFTNELC